jgi:hypothetical protein
MKTTIDMAHEVYGEHTFWNEAQLLRLKEFERLVRADERMSFYGQDKPAECADGCPPNLVCDYCQVVAPAKAMILAEREACAKVCDELANDENIDEYINGADWCSVRIRARGNTMTDKQMQEPVAWARYPRYTGQIQKADIVFTKPEGKDWLELYTTPPAQPAQKKPQNCGTSYCSCVECVMEPAPVQEPVAWLYKGDAEFDGKEWRDNIRVTTSKQVADWQGKDIQPLYTTPPAQPAVPDAFGTREGEHPQYVQGWNDCRAEMLKGRHEPV